MAQKVLKSCHPTSGYGLREVLEVQSQGLRAYDIPIPPSSAEEVKASCDSFVLSSFTAQDAWELGHLLYARLLPFASKQPTLISIALANSSQVLFQTAVGSGAVPDNETWVQRKRNSVLRWGCSTWFLHCKYAADEELFRAKFGMSEEQAGKYAIHGGGVPIRVQGVEGIVAVVVVSGLAQHEDHGVIVDVIQRHWA
ncbi:uncharacterized protein BCR38DRAFT_460062 [Pseudomassariella vexata]|uniref:DUF967 domain protein n=1 Tax=Pseudomassariella vexata TaxID=1141098 RepID=A0A1Y2DLL5_9PEZI|nr:uncharacterized protein BCR38DRAFT_460062 [Pseudomassariella vexata]ORY60101.1 hypothetical protein BCR38DRAFT_460062 [Pseudomassariella vexata]